MRCLAVIVLLLLAVGAPARAAAPLLTLTNYVVDGANILPANVEAELIAKLRAHNAATTNQVAVATVKTLKGQTIEDAALAILRTTGLGQADRNNGVLLLIAVEERRIRIEVGYGLEGALPDARAGQIISRDIGPRFKAGDMAGGVQAGVDAILAAIAGEYKAAPKDEEPPWVPYAIVIGWILIVMLIKYHAHRRRERRRALGQDQGSSPWYWIDDDDGWGGGGGFGGGGGGFGGGGGSGGGGGASGGW